MKRYVKKAVQFIIYKYFLIKIYVYIKIYGVNGLNNILKNLPELFIIPIMKKYGLNIGENSRILPGILFNHLSGKKPFKNLSIGRNVYIGRNVLFDISEKIILEDDSAIGAGSQIWTHVGNYTYDFTDYFEKRMSVKIGKGVLCWANVVISPGVVIADYSRVAAGSVVINNIESKAFYGGVPAKFIKERNIK